MRAARLSCSSSILWLVLVPLAAAFDPLTLSLAAGGVGFLGMTIGGIYTYLQRETCNGSWISLHLTSLQAELEGKLFGQHIASPLILKAVNGFMTNPSPEKPLVLSLHGTTGTGKNLASKMIAGSIYRNGLRSQFVHLLVASRDFPHESEVETYKVGLRAFIERSVEKCERSLFIFDEMDQMHPGLIDVIKPYLDHHAQLGGVSYRRTIFIFLNMAGGPEISRITLNSLIAGRSREDIKLKDLEEEISQAVFNHDGGFFQSDLIDRSLVDFFVPFLPLQRRHVIQCIFAEMRKRGLRRDAGTANRLADDLRYFPEEENLFSVRGCKTIQDRLSFYL